MRIPESCRKCVVFIGPQSKYGFTPTGTAFLVATPMGDLHYSFLVTAAHVIDDIAGDLVSIRLNKTSGELVVIQLRKSSAMRHANKSNDIAVFSFRFKFDDYDHKFYIIERSHFTIARDERSTPDLGDEVAVIGLYTSHYGAGRNVPIVRTGNIAMLPGEPVQCGAGYAAAYLIEARSIAGLSGSPVLLNSPEFFVVDGALRARGDYPNLLMGVLIGYHSTQSKQDEIEVAQFQGDERDPLSTKPLPTNTGLAVVIPAERILDILESPANVFSMQAASIGYHAAAGFSYASPTFPLPK